MLLSPLIALTVSQVVLAPFSMNILHVPKRNMCTCPHSFSCPLILKLCYRVVFFLLDNRFAFSPFHIFFTLQSRNFSCVCDKESVFLSPYPPELRRFLADNPFCA